MYKLRAIAKKKGGAVFFMSDDLTAIKKVAKNMSNCMGTVYVEDENGHEKEINQSK
jgi:hypothetical protein